jgi:glyoxylase-like metal-dependent hydrolase (beta-lactamase superfamily II)
MSIPFITKVTPEITMIHLSDLDSNIYLIGKDTVVDTGTGFNFVRLFDIFKRLGVSFEQVKFVVNTHMHYDHVGGNNFFENAKVLIHEHDAPVVEKADQKMSNADFFGGKMKQSKSVQRLKDGETFKNFKIIHTPGHSRGSICLYDEKSKLLISGDTIFSDGVGRTDLPGGNEEELEASLEKLMTLKIDKILCGHGAPVMKAVPKEIQKIIENVSDVE